MVSKNYYRVRIYAEFINHNLMSEIYILTKSKRAAVKKALWQFYSENYNDELGELIPKGKLTRIEVETLI